MAFTRGGSEFKGTCGGQDQDGSVEESLSASIPGDRRAIGDIENGLNGDCERDMSANGNVKADKDEMRMGTGGCEGGMSGNMGAGWSVPPSHLGFTYAFGHSCQ